MAHYAKLDKNNIVLEVNTIDNPQENSLGDLVAVVTWLKNGWGGSDWKKTSYNTRENTHILGGTPFRKNYAGIGFTYDGDRDAFIPPQNYPSWVLNEDTCQWKSPIPYPEVLEGSNEFYKWDEETIQWIRIDETG